MVEVEYVFSRNIALSPSRYREKKIQRDQKQISYENEENIVKNKTNVKNKTIKTKTNSKTNVPSENKSNNNNNNNTVIME